MRRSTNNPWLHRYAVGVALMTLALIGLGGLVTSHGVGLAVPDWPTTYGYNMFFFPVSKWVGGVFYEHTHRLLASAVGLLTVILAVWLWLQEERAWVRWLGVGAVGAVSLQGVLGGLRVVQFKDELGIFHAGLAQLFFVLLGALALFTSRWWHEAARARLAVYGGDGLRYVYLLTSGMILLQLILGATMRHQHAGLAIPDFPLAYGGLWPAMDAGAVAAYNQQRLEATALNPITPAHVALQMAHRLGALLILLAVAWTAFMTAQRVGRRASLTKWSFGWLALILLQALLGALTIWSNKSADIATAHVVVGALSLLSGTLLFLAATRCLVNATAPRAVRAVQPSVVGASVKLPA